ncbi:MAG: hypothetical protein ACNA8W_24170, partial [Bradymonadaceae bacterium]
HIIIKDSLVLSNEGGGLWLQSGTHSPRAHIEKSLFVRNSGAAILAMNAHVFLSESDLRWTQRQAFMSGQSTSFELGDGLHLRSSSARISATSIDRNATFGFFIGGEKLVSMHASTSKNNGRQDIATAGRDAALYIYEGPVPPASLPNEDDLSGTGGYDPEMDPEPDEETPSRSTSIEDDVPDDDDMFL